MIGSWLSLKGASWKGSVINKHFIKRILLHGLRAPLLFILRWFAGHTLFVSNFMLHFDTVAHIVTSNAQNNCCHWAIVLEPMGNKWHQQGHRDGFWRGGFSFTVFSLNSPSWFTLDHSHTDFIINQASTFMEYIKRMNNLVKSAADKVLNNFLCATISYCSSALITLLLVLPSPDSQTSQGGALKPSL